LALMGKPPGVAPGRFLPAPAVNRRDDFVEFCCGR